MSIIFAIATSLFTVYLYTMVKMFGIPPSLSDTYYLLEGTKKGAGILFTFIMFILVFTFAPIMIEVSTESTQFLAFLSLLGIGFVGAAPKFKGVTQESRVHIVGAFIAAISSTLWMLFNISYKTIPNIQTVVSVVLLCALPVVLTVLICKTKTLRTSYIFWGEMAALFALFFTFISKL